MVDPVVLQTPRRRLFVGSYARVSVLIDPATGTAFDDLRIEVPGGPEAGTVSLSHDRRFNIERPTILLLAGSRPGRYILQAFHIPTDSLFAETKFGIIDLCA